MPRPLGTFRQKNNVWLRLLSKRKKYGEVKVPNVLVLASLFQLWADHVIRVQGLFVEGTLVTSRTKQQSNGTTPLGDSFVQLLVGMPVSGEVQP